jgi:hypothetical protein
MLVGRSPGIYTEREGVTWHFQLLSLLYSSLIIQTLLIYYKPWSNIILDNLPDFLASNDTILKNYVSPTITFKKKCFLKTNTLPFIQACKTPDYWLIAGSQNVTPSHFFVTFFHIYVVNILSPNKCLFVQWAR